MKKWEKPAIIHLVLEETSTCPKAIYLWECVKCGIGGYRLTEQPNGGYVCPKCGDPIHYCVTPS